MNSIYEQLSRHEFKNLMDLAFRIEYILTKTMRCVGLVGSVLMFAVYLQPRSQQLSVSIYFRCMALVCFILNTVKLIMVDYFFQIYKVSGFLGKILDFLPKFFVPLSAWLEVLACLDRFLTILFPFKFKFIQKRTVQLLLIAAVFILNTLLNLDYAIGTKYLHKITGIPENEQGRLKIKEIIAIKSLVNSSLLPFAIMLVTSLATFVGVLRAHRRIKSSSNRRDNSQRKLLRDIKFGVTMVVLNVTFFVCIGLHHLKFLVNIDPFNWKTHSIAYFIWEYILGNLPDFYYFLIFFIQLVVNSVVRHELVNIFNRILRKQTFCLPNRNTSSVS